jgi:hypothetical protein
VHDVAPLMCLHVIDVIAVRHLTCC